MGKQPLSAYFLFSQEERLKVKEGHPNYSICEIAKELGRRWADMNPEVKQHYQQKAEEGRQKYDQEMAAYRQYNRFEDPKPKRDPTMPKQPLSSYFLFSQEERLKVMAEQARQKYDQDMAAHRQANPTPPAVAQNTNQNTAPTSKFPGTVPTTVPQPGGAGYAALSGSDYSSFLLQ